MRLRNVRNVTIGCLVVSLISTALVHADPPPSLDALRKQKLETAQKWFAAEDVAYQDGTARVIDLYAASLAWKTATYEVAADKAARVAALQAHADRIAKIHARIDALHAIAAAGGEADKEWASQTWLLEAQIWVAEEEAKP